MSLFSIGTASADGHSNSVNSDCLFAPTHQSCTLDTLNIFVGPQSVEPGETIYIAIEASNKLGGSAIANTVIIVDEISGKEYPASVNNGLAYMEISAPSQTGRLTFHAMDSEIKSSSAEVLVHAAKPEKFDLRLEKNRSQVFVTSSLLTDSFGNLIEDGQMADILVRTGNKVVLTSQAQTQNARLSFHLDCQKLRGGDLNLSVRVRGANSQSDIPSYFCTQNAQSAR